MVKIVVAAPNKQTAELECEATDTFGAVKLRIEAVWGVPPAMQRLLCNGRERKNAAETLASAGVSTKTKIMLMLAPGYSMPVQQPPEATAAGGEASPEAEIPPEPVSLEGKLPVPDGLLVSEPAAAVVLVRHGRNRYRVHVAQGLAAATFGELASFLSAEMLPPGIPASELRLICRGKAPASADLLSPEGGKELSVMLIFREGFHRAADGANWLSEFSLEISEAEKLLERLGRRVEANFSDAETLVKLAEVEAKVDVVTQSVDSVVISEAKLAELRRLKERALAAAERVAALRKLVR